MSNLPPADQGPDPANRHTPATHRFTAWRPSRRTLLLAALAFVIGLLLFALLWWRDHGNDFYRASGVLPPSQDQQFEPLPAPLPAEASGGNASGMGEPGNAPDTAAPRVIEAPPAPMPPPRRAPAPSGEAGPAGAQTAPTPIESPAPDYPREAFRNGESGTVLLRVHVDADGIPSAVDLVESSHSRSLDRAASDAVRRWRFRPAQRDGHAVPGEVQIPISFNADR